MPVDVTEQQEETCERERAAASFLHTLPGIGKKTLQNLQENVGSLWKVFEMEPATLKPLVRGQKGLQSLKEARHQQQEAWNYYQQLKSQEIGVLLCGDKDYPRFLAEIFDPPFILYWKGDLSVANHPALAVVGCRESTAYGREQARRFSEELARTGVVIVSGLARGIDTSAHEGALQNPKGKTIAVLGSGISVIYPSENKELAQRIVENGLLLSEFIPASHPEPGHFPQRNRIISGLSRGVLVVEARKKSGALITADFAMEQGREVYAIPGMITNPCSEGTHHLIQQGAKLVTKSEDILEDYAGFIRQELNDIDLFDQNQKEKKIDFKEQGPSPWMETEELQILEVLSEEPKPMDEILLQVQMSPGDLMKWLLQMEIQGKVLSLPGNCYRKKNDK